MPTAVVTRLVALALRPPWSTRLNSYSPKSWLSSSFRRSPTSRSVGGEGPRAYQARSRRRSSPAPAGEGRGAPGLASEAWTGHGRLASTSSGIEVAPRSRRAAHARAGPFLLTTPGWRSRAAAVSCRSALPRSGGWSTTAGFRGTAGRWKPMADVAAAATFTGAVDARIPSTV